MNLSFGQNCLILLVITFVLAGFSQVAENPSVLVTVLVLVALGIVIALRLKKTESVKRLTLLDGQAANLDKLAKGEFEVDGVIFSTKPDEVVVHRLDQVLLKEYRSNGSTFGGGYGGVSFPLFGAVRGNVGGMRGGTTRKPEESTPIDVGVVTFTNQRIVFAGDNVVREFDLDKIVNLETGDNGITLEIAVSNREKTSVLAANNWPALTPGMAASIALAWKKDGKNGAMEDAADLSKRLKEAIESERFKSYK